MSSVIPRMPPSLFYFTMRRATGALIFGPLGKGIILPSSCFQIWCFPARSNWNPLSFSNLSKSFLSMSCSPAIITICFHVRSSLVPLWWSGGGCF